MTTTKPAAAKKPTDRQPKATNDTTITVTVGGQEWTVEKEALDDFELLEDLNRAETDQDPMVFPSIFNRLVGEGGWDRAKEACRDEKSGRVRLSGVSTLLGELLGALDPNS